MKNNFKNVMRKVVFLQSFQISLTSDLIEDSRFLLDASVFSLLQCIVLATNTISCFPEATGLLGSFSEKMSAIYQGLNNHSLSYQLFFQVKMKDHEKSD